MEDGCVLWGTRVVIPSSGRSDEGPGPKVCMVAGMDTDIEGLVRKSEQCQLHKKLPAEAPQHPWEWPSEPWTRLHVNYAGKFKGEVFLIVVDACSKWLEVHLMKLTTSSATIEKLMQIFSTHGLPRTIVSYNGTNFTSSELNSSWHRMA